MLRTRCGDQWVAQDICHDALIVVIRRLRKEPLEDPEKLSGYVAGVAKRLLWNHVRKEIRQDTHADSEAIARVESQHAEVWHLLYREGMRQYLRDRIAELNAPQYRKILTDHYLLERHKQVIAQEMDLDLKAYNTVLYRARKRLVEAIEGMADGVSESELLEAFALP